MTAYIQVETGAVFEKDVGAPPPGNDPSEQIARHLVRRKATLAAQGAGDPVFVLHTENAPFHGGEGTGRSFIGAWAPYD
jgi:hypothetical protein